MDGENPRPAPTFETLRHELAVARIALEGERRRRDDTLGRLLLADQTTPVGLREHYATQRPEYQRAADAFSAAYANVERASASVDSFHMAITLRRLELDEATMLRQAEQTELMRVHAAELEQMQRRATELEQSLARFGADGRGGDSTLRPS